MKMAKFGLQWFLPYHATSTKPQNLLCGIFLLRLRIDQGPDSREEGTHIKLVGYCWNGFDELVFMAGPKPLLTELGIHHSSESCAQ